MDIAPLFKILGIIGEKWSWAVQKFINFLGELGVNLTLVQSKILNVVLSLVAIIIIIKFIELPKKLIKYAIIGLLALLIFSIILSLINPIG